MRFGTSTVWATLGAAGLVLASLLAACANGESQGLGVDDTPTTTNDEKDSGNDSVLPPGDDSGSDDGTDSDGGSSSKPDGGGSKGDAGKDSGSVDPDDDAGSSNCTTAAPSNACGVAPQCGCGANETCEVTKTDGTVACKAAGSAALGHACSKAGDCAVGLTCVDGACRPYCATPNDPCTGTDLGTCFAPEDAQGNATPNKSVCSIECDPLAPSALCGTNNCVWFSGDKIADCVTAGTGGTFDDCSSLLDCQPGYQCFLYMGTYPECEKWCVLGKAGECGSDTCTDAFGANAPKSGGQKLGLCQ